MAILDKGRIKAMAGGFDNFFYNRAVDARRQFGSVFKPIVYLAALQLGWNNLDPLFNGRNVFSYGGTLYFPRPDHESHNDWVSMAWAGVKSENVASVWLLYNLCDQLTYDQIKELAENLGMSPVKEETYKDYLKRVRDGYGIVVNEERLKEAAFDEAKKELLADLIFAGKDKEAEELRFLKYSRRGNLNFSPPSGKYEAFKEMQILKEVLRHEYKRLLLINDELNISYQQIERFLKLTDTFGIFSQSREAMEELLKNFYYRHKGDKGEMAYTPDFPENDLAKLTYPKLQELLDGNELRKMFPVKSILVDDKITSLIIDELSMLLKEKLETLKQFRSYDLQTLCRIKDFRVQIGLRYVVDLAKKLGVESNLAPVLSFPLGANAINILELTKLYSVFAEGKIYLSSPDGIKGEANIILKIVDPEGELIYQYEPGCRRIANEKISYLVADILKNVIRYGTGKKAWEENYLTSDIEERNRLFSRIEIKPPLFGKTGTANDFSNSCFVGLVPYFAKEEEKLELKNSYVIAAYLGYDDNRPMINRKRGVKIFGSEGALPLWIDIVKSVISINNFSDHVDLVDLVFQKEKVVPLKSPAILLTIPCRKEDGMPNFSRNEVEENETVPLETLGKRKGNLFMPLRLFAPFANEN